MPICKPSSARVILNWEKYKRAGDILTKANEAIPNDNHIMFLLGEAYTNFHKPKEAIEWFTKIIEVEGRRLPHILISMSQAAKRGGDFDQAIAWAEEAIALHPEGIAPKNYLARILAIIGDKKKAADRTTKCWMNTQKTLGRSVALVTSINSAKVIQISRCLKSSTSMTLKPSLRKREDKYRVHSWSGLWRYGAVCEIHPHPYRSNARRRKFLEYDFQREVDRFDLMKHVFEPITPPIMLIRTSQMIAR